jgi:putative intracellular protease/amidase
MRVLIPLPDRDFDTTEVAVPWHVLRQAGHEIVFATERGEVAACDPLLLTGVIFGKLGAEAEPRAFYAELEKSAEFRKPIRYDAIDPTSFAAIVLPGGHAPGMKQYLDSEVLRHSVAQFFALEREVAAICHGVLVLARTRGPGASAGRSVIHDRRTTCLPKWMERSAYFMTAWKHGRYYRTYDAYVEDEVRAALDKPEAQFVRGPFGRSARGTATDHGPAMIVEDGNYLSARWPGDAYLFSEHLAERLSQARRGG